MHLSTSRTSFDSLSFAVSTSTEAAVMVLAVFKPSYLVFNCCKSFTVSSSCFCRVRISAFKRSFSSFNESHKNMTCLMRTSRSTSSLLLLSDTLLDFTRLKTKNHANIAIEIEFHKLIAPYFSNFHSLRMILRSSASDFYLFFNTIRKVVPFPGSDVSTLIFHP